MDNSDIINSSDNKIIYKKGIFKDMCKCCEEIEIWKEINQNNENLTDKIFAKLAIYSWRKGEKKIRGNQRSTVISRSYDLKYCPLCGKKQ